MPRVLLTVVADRNYIAGSFTYGVADVGRSTIITGSVGSAGIGWLAAASLADRSFR